MEPLKTNSELYQYLLLLVSRLRSSGAADLADLVQFATQQASGMSTEFLGEARIALEQLLEKEQGILTATQRKEINNVIGQLGTALNGR